LIEAEREFIYRLLRNGKITDEARRRIEYELDLEEASVANRRAGRWRVDVANAPRPCWLTARATPFPPFSVSP